MTLGEINKSDLFDSGESLEPYTEIAYIIFVCFLFLMPMVLINLTIGISVGDIDSILRTSYITRYALQVEMIFGLEKRFPSFIQRKVWQSSYSFYPNRQNPTLWRKMKLLLIGTGRESSSFLGNDKETSATLDDLMSGFNRHEQALSDFSIILNRQSDILRRLAEKNDIKIDL
ncbi:transient receptor potential cation channel subfamily A member 1-like [Amphiura filiformis]|uniref:transient receptor potential cation channel subfamily A member 1-like n=1 Tax=Amphiura filiformis TaxID=82378 RepID=UPI003B213D68